MELRIFWTEFALLQLENIFNYYEEKANFNIAQNLVVGIFNSVQKPTYQPEIGQVEPFLVGSSEELRYLVFKSYKIIYWVNTDKSRIEIWDVFDTRQNPIKILRNK